MEGVEVALGGVAAASVADEDRVAALGHLQRVGHHRHEAGPRQLFVVGRARHDAGHGGARFEAVDRTVDIAAQDRAVAHRHADIFLDDHIV